MTSIPFYKLGVLTIKTLSKPIAKSIQSRARNSDNFKNVCINIGNINNKVTYYFKRLNYKKQVTYVPISESVAIETGSNLLGEGIIYVIGGGLVIEEYTRSKINKAIEFQEREERFKKIEAKLDEISKKIEA